MTSEYREFLERFEKKLDIIIGFFNMTGEKRPSPKELEDWAKSEVAKHNERKRLKSSPQMGKVLPIKRKGDRKDECETSQG